jgi:predicted nucleotidyltransferase
MNKIDQIEKVTSYNEKIKLNFIRFLLKEEVFSFDDMKSQGNEEYENLLSAYEIFLNSTLDKAAIKALLKAVNGNEEQMDTNYIEELLESNFNDYSISECVNVFVDIVQKQVFYEKTEEIAKLIFNKLLELNGYCPVVFYPKLTRNLLNHIQSGSTEEIIEKIFIKLIFRTIKHLNTKQSLLQQEAVLNLILQHEKMIKQVYHVTSLGVFGSFARNEQNEYSDIDLWIKVNQEFSNEDKYALCVMLQTVLGVYVDLSVWTTELDAMLFHDSLTVF